MDLLAGPAPAVALAALLSGAAVLAVTVAADRMGGRIGGLLSTAPVTTTAALVHLAPQGGLALKVAAGGLSLFAAIAAMPVYFFLVRATRGRPLGLRIVAGLVAYVAAFTATTAALQWATPPALHSWWYAATLVVTALYAASFLRLRIDPAHLRGPKPPLTWKEGVARFAAGAAVILLVEAIGAWNPVLGAAWAVFPGTFLVSLAVMGFGHGAAFSARACQAGVLGGVPLAAFLVTYMMLVSVHDSLAWAWTAMVPAWGVYFSALLALQRGPVGGAPEARPAASS